MKTEAGASEQIIPPHSSALYDLLYYINTPVGICTAAAATASFYINGIPANIPCILFIFCSTAFVYNLERLKPTAADKINSPERFYWIEENKGTVIKINISLLAACLYLLFANFSRPVIGSAFALLFLSLCYNSRIKKLPAMKNIMVASIWTITVAIFPIIWEQTSLRALNIQYSLICFGCAFINTIIFDIRDFSGDKQYGVKSIPVLIGKQNSRLLCFIVGLSTALISIYSELTILALIPALYAALIVLNESRLKYLLADLILALPLLILL